MKKWLVLIKFVFLIFCIAKPAEALFISPEAAFTSRESELLDKSGYEYVIAGGVNSGFLAVHKTINDVFPYEVTMEDRTNLEFDLFGQAQSSESVYLNFYLSKTFGANKADIALYSYSADGLVNPQDYFRTDSYIASFDNLNLFQPDPSFNAFSLDVTDIYNQSLLNNNQRLGFIFKIDGKGSIDGSDFYVLNNSDTNSKLYKDISLSSHTLPPLPEDWQNSSVPEPATLLLLGGGLAGAIWRRRKITKA